MRYKCGDNTKILSEMDGGADWAGEFIDFNFTTHGTLSETREAICDGDIEGRSQRTL